MPEKLFILIAYSREKHKDIKRISKSVDSEQFIVLTMDIKLINEIKKVFRDNKPRALLSCDAFTNEGIENVIATEYHIKKYIESAFMQIPVTELMKMN